MGAPEKVEFETFRDGFSEKAKLDHEAFFKTPLEKLQKVLELIEYGKLLPEIWLERREREWNRKISRMTGIKVQEVPRIMRVISNALSGLQERKFILKRASDLKKIGYSNAEIGKFLKVAMLLRENKGASVASKMDQWIALSEEILPLLSFVECSFDIRCGVKNGKVVTFIPMVLMKFRTMEGESKAPKELIFQMQIGDLRHFARGITEMYRNAAALKEYVVQLKGEK